MSMTSDAVHEACVENFKEYITQVIDERINSLKNMKLARKHRYIHELEQIKNKIMRYK